MIHPRRARPPIKANARPQMDAEVVAMVRTLQQLFATETWAAPCTYRQCPTLRAVLKDRAERVARLFAGRGGQ